MDLIHRSISTGQPIECFVCDADRATREIHACSECGKGGCAEHVTRCSMCGEKFHCAEHGYPTLNLRGELECRACYDAELDDAAADILASPMWGRAETVSESFAEVA